jgi:hypothetical protein
VSLDAYNHFQDCVGDETNVIQGQDGEEEINGSVEVRISGNGCDNEQVSKHQYQIHAG